MSARRLASVAGFAAAALAVPAFAAAPATSATPAPEQAAGTVASYTGSATDQAANKAFFDAVMRTAAAKRKPGVAAVTVVYDPSGAPTFANEISQSAQIWNDAVDNVELVAGGNADFDYYEGNDPRGSYAYTDGHGHGYVFIDYAQSQVYNPLRIVAHETGHILGLPDHYEGPCSELMSGGGPGPSCTNAVPDANERARVEQLWANGKTSLGTFATVR
jgi:snapalysin